MTLPPYAILAAVLLAAGCSSSTYVEQQGKRFDALGSAATDDAVERATGDNAPSVYRKCDAMEYRDEIRTIETVGEAEYLRRREGGKRCAPTPIRRRALPEGVDDTLLPESGGFD